jgi:hydrogenase maturation protein HypF
VAIEIRGVVQGVGFRPFVYHAARREGLQGWVLNDVDAVRIEAEGPGSAMDRFLEVLRHHHPVQARLESMVTTELQPADQPDSRATFVIRASQGRSTPGPTIPADSATCAECRVEISDPAQRRHRYPFTNCTHCGPRWSIITQLPYDRWRTSMREFAMCPACRGEYESPADRRFHAQPVACPKCGPHLELLSSAGQRLSVHDEALREAAAAVLDGHIVALKGLGGFQLIVDATHGAAVRRLRDRKHRPDKPFAIMVAAANDVTALCDVTADDLEALNWPQAPILLLRRRGNPLPPHGIAEEIAPNNPYLGVMLPYTPLHHLLMSEIRRPVVCTSGNRSEEPMATTIADALQRLGDIADVILTHNRPIVRPVDDSVARIAPQGPQLLRRARGYAPLPIHLDCSPPCTLALGGHLKNTVALSRGADVIISSHIGDLDNLLSLEVHRRAVRDLVDFFSVTAEIVACDLHPDYASTRHAEELADQWSVPLVRVQHHHAHVLSLMAEHQLRGPLLGFSWDGTGYGPDGTVWGGETFLCEGADLRRIAHLRTFPLPGGDRAVHDPRRTALGLLYEMQGPACRELVASWFDEPELATLLQALQRPRLFPRSSSMGRLFDAVAAICGWQGRVSFEGQAAMALEFAAADGAADPYPLPITKGEPAVVDWQPLVEHVIADLGHGYPLAHIAARFHQALVSLAVRIARRVGCSQVGLSGGCFQNALLSDHARQQLLEAGFEVYTQQQVPPGDGGIALGQVLAAAWQVGE